jgi:rfaE bifunctional protein kinase chain/domain
VLTSRGVQRQLAFPKLSKLTIAVAGDFVADEYVYGQTDRVSREAPVPIVNFERSELRLGGAGNVANNLVALGVHVRALGALGKDAAGRAVRQACRHAGIDVSALLESPAVQTAVKTRMLAGALHTTRQQLLRLDRGAPVPDAEGRRIAARLSRVLRGCDALVISDYGLGNVHLDLIREVRRVAHRLPVLVDSRANLKAFRGVTLIKPNAPELAALAGRPLPDLAAIRRAGKGILKANAIQGLLVTRGRDGLALLSRNGRGCVLPVFGAAEAVDVTGAGDTVLACFAAVYAATKDMVRAAELANVAAGLVVQKPGTATVSAEEIAAAIEG